MVSNNQQKTLSKEDFQTIAYFAVGVSSESKSNAYKLVIAANTKNGKLYPVGNSGYSIGTIQTDLGQHPEVVKDLVDAYQKWALETKPEWKLSEKQEKDIIHDLGRTGREIKKEDGRPLPAEFKARFDQFFSSKDGITWVHTRDVKQINKIEKNIFTPLQETELYKKLSFDDKIQLVAVTSKLYNQSERNGRTVLQEIKNGKFHSVNEVNNRIDSILEAKNDYIETGRKEAVLGAILISQLNKMGKNNILFDEWDSVKTNPLKNPSKLEGDKKNSYDEIRKLFNDPEKSINKIKREEGKKVSAQVSRDDFSALIDNLISDKDGSFTKQVIADNKNIVAALDAKVQEKIIQEQQNMAQEVQQKANEQSFGGRSLG
mgnify:CR=1 FL=1